MSRAQVAVALVHHPVVDRQGDTVTTAVTNLDIHDIARSAKTYGVSRFYVVTPVVEQQQLVGRILEHWCKGHGAKVNPDRRRALDLVEVVDSLEQALSRWKTETDRPVRPLLTGARGEGGVSYTACRQRLEQEAPMVVFGTGWGLAPQLFSEGWERLEPIRGSDDYNHLSVRGAAAIILDRLLGDRGTVD